MLLLSSPSMPPAPLFKPLRYAALNSKLLVLLLVVISFGCTVTPHRFENSINAGYTLGRPFVQKLPPELDEISGLHFVAEDSSLLAVGDERGYLYKIHPAFPERIDRWKFGADGDYEDVSRVADTVYVLESNGNIHSVYITADSTKTTVYTFPFEKGEFETLYHDSALGKLVLIAKDYEPDKKSALSLFYFDPITHAYSAAEKKIEVTPIANALDKNKIRFKPSAAAIHPITGHLFMISAVNNVLVEALTDGTVTNVFPLEKGIFKQPEGIAFSPRGTLFISNEAAEIGVANVLIYSYKIQK